MKDTQQKQGAKADSRKFKLRWYEGYAKCKPEVYRMDGFTDDMGFTEEHREEIQGLVVGQKATFAGPLERMTVKRIK